MLLLIDSSELFLFAEKVNHDRKSMADVDETVETVENQRGLPAAEVITMLMESGEQESGEIKMVGSLEELSAVEGDGTINEEEYGEWHPLTDMSSASLFNASEMEVSELPSLKLPVDCSNNSTDLNGRSSTFLEMEFVSEEMQKFLAYQEKTQPTYTSIEDMMYKSSELFPDW